MNSLAPVPRIEMDPELKRWLSALRDTYNGAPVTPPGAVVASYAATATGWLPLDGQAVSKRDYAALYAVIGGAYGETATTFNLPDATGTPPAVGTAWLIKT